MKRKRKIMVLVATCSIALSVALLVEAQPPMDENRPLTVITWNLYLGGNVGPLLHATDTTDLVGKVTALWASVQQTDFTDRAEVIADQIALKQPDLIGLQEVVLWRMQSPGDFVTGNFVPNAETVVYDFLQILLDMLEMRGLHYDVLAVVEALDAEAPDFNFDDIRLTDRDVILVRSDVRSRRFEFSNVQEENFQARIVLNLLGMVPIEILSNWASVDVHTPDKTLRFVTTHLSAFSQTVRLAQAGELLSGPLDTDVPVIFLGDLNSDAAAADLISDAPAYSLLVSNGFVDTWNEKGIGDGFTAHQNNDLLNQESALDQRIDVVLYKGSLRILRSDLVGEEQKDRTTSGLWPSDHVGINTQLMFHTGEGQ